MYKVNLLKVAGILTCVVALGLYLQNAFDGYGVLKMESLHPHLVAQTNTGSTGGYTCWSCGGYGDCTVCWGKHDYCVGDCSYGECTCSPPSGNDCLENRSGGSGYKVSRPLDARGHVKIIMQLLATVEIKDVLQAIAKKTIDDFYDKRQLTASCLFFIQKKL